MNLRGRSGAGAIGSQVPGSLHEGHSAKETLFDTPGKSTGGSSSASSNLSGAALSKS